MHVSTFFAIPAQKCYDMEEEGESELTVVLREALWAYIYMRHTPNPRIEEKTILPLTIIL